MPVVEIITLLGSIAAIVSALNDGSDIYKKWKKFRKERKDKKASKEQLIELNQSEVDLSVLRCKVDILNEFKRCCNDLGSEFKDATAPEALKKVLEEINHKLEELRQQHQRNNVEEAFRDFENASESTRCQVLKILNDLHDRLSIARPASPSHRIFGAITNQEDRKKLEGETSNAREQKLLEPKSDHSAKKIFELDAMTTSFLHPPASVPIRDRLSRTHHDRLRGLNMSIDEDQNNIRASYMNKCRQHVGGSSGSPILADKHIIEEAAERNETGGYRLTRKESYIWNIPDHGRPADYTWPDITPPREAFYSQPQSPIFVRSPSRILHPQSSREETQASPPCLPGNYSMSGGLMPSYGNPKGWDVERPQSVLNAVDQGVGRQSFMNLNKDGSKSLDDPLYTSRPSPRPNAFELPAGSLPSRTHSMNDANIHRTPGVMFGQPQSTNIDQAPALVRPRANKIGRAVSEPKHEHNVWQHAATAVTDPEIPSISTLNLSTTWVSTARRAFCEAGLRLRSHRTMPLNEIIAPRSNTVSCCKTCKSILNVDDVTLTVPFSMVAENSQSRLGISLKARYLVRHHLASKPTSPGGYSRFGCCFDGCDQVCQNRMEFALHIQDFHLKNDSSAWNTWMTSLANDPDVHFM